VRVVDEARKGLVLAREAGRRATSGDVLVYLDADCRAPLTWLARVERHFRRDARLIALSAPYRFYDWDWWGRTLIRAYDITLAPATQLLVKHVLRLGTISTAATSQCAETRSIALGDSTRRLSSTARTRTWAAGSSRWARWASTATVFSKHPRGGTSRWERPPCSGSTSAISHRSCCATAQGHESSGCEDLTPGYEPFLLCDFHVHTRWSDGRLTVTEVVDLYGQTGRFDVLAITDHILMKKDLLARAGRLATLGRRNFGVREENFDAYLADIRSEAKRAQREYGMLVVPGAEVTQNHIRSSKNAHIIALDIKKYISADPCDRRHRVDPAAGSTFTSCIVLAIGPPGPMRTARTS